jgi:hypothetical protein
VFGGVDLFAYHNDLWRWNSSTGWSFVPVAGTLPQGRMYSTLVYDAPRDRYVVFGGHPAYLNDVWILSLRPVPAWAPLAPAGAPPAPRFNHAAVMDETHDRMIVFGGITSGGEVGDTWALDFSGTPTWQSLPTAGTAPGPLRVMGYTLDTARQRMLMFGGYDGSQFVNTTYAFSLATNQWSQLLPGGALPAVRDLMSIHYESSRDHVVLFGGFNPGGFLDDVWTLGDFDPPQTFEARRGIATGLTLRAENPLRSSGIRLTLGLPAAGDVDLELIDISGRRVLRRSYPGFAAGLHRVELRDVRVIPGVYFARLTHNGQVAMTRLAVVR